MPGWFANLARLFKTDVSVDPDASSRVPGKTTPYIGGEDDRMGDAFDRYQQFMSQEDNRKALYDLYDTMDMTDIVGLILDLYAESATTVNHEHGRSVWVTSKNKKLEAHCNKFLQDQIEEDICALARDLAKYGDFYDRTVYQKGFGIKALHGIHPNMVDRKEDKTHKLLGFKQEGKKFRRGSGVLSYPWDYIHYRLRGRDRKDIYGTSILYHMIRPWRQLILAEDHSLLYQISRHPDRNMFMIDVGQMDEVEAQKVVRRFKEMTRRSTHRDPKSGSMDHRFNPITPMEDIYLGTRRDSNTRVEKLSGSANAQDILNLTYYVNKLFSAGKTPKGAFGHESRFEYNSKAQLANQDIRFARAVYRVQRAVKFGIRTMLEIDLILKMKDPEKDAWMDFRREGSEFEVHMDDVSYLMEMERLELQQLRYQVADQMIQSGRGHEAFSSFQWVKYIFETYLHFDDAKIKRLLVGPKKAGDREDMTFGAPKMMGQQAAAQAAAYNMDGTAEQGQAAAGEETAGEKQAAEARIDTKISNAIKVQLDEIIEHSPEIQAVINSINDGGVAKQAVRSSPKYRPLPLDEGELNKDELEDDWDNIDWEAKKK